MLEEIHGRPGCTFMLFSILYYLGHGCYTHSAAALPLPAIHINKQLQTQDSTQILSWRGVMQWCTGAPAHIPFNFAAL